MYATPAWRHVILSRVKHGGLGVIGLLGSRRARIIDGRLNVDIIQCLALDWGRHRKERGRNALHFRAHVANGVRERVCAQRLPLARQVPR